MNLSIFNYSNPIDYLSDFVKLQKENDLTFSIRNWAKSMGLKSHNLLVMILNEKRSLRQTHMNFLSKGLNLNFNEKMYFQTLIEYHNASDPEQKRLYQHFLIEFNPVKDFNIKEVDEFKIISDWHHMAILSMTGLKNFQLTPESIVKKLKFSIEEKEIKKAIDRLINLNLLKLDENGKLVCTCYRLTTKNDILNEGAQIYHNQVTKLAMEALKNDDPLIREFQSFSMSIDEDKIPLAKEMIREFRRKLSKAVSGGGEIIYQTNIQFFQLTESPNLGDEGVEAEVRMQ